jgi:sugar lactone lactonase YvrE
VAAAPAGATTFNFVRSFGGSGATQFSGPTWVAVDSVNHWVYVTDAGHNRIKRFNFDGTAANFTAGTGSGSNNLGPHYVANGACGDSPVVCFSDPQGIAVDSSGNLFVANNASADVAEFSSTGAFIRQFGAFDDGGFDSGGGAGTDNLGSVAGLAVDSSGHVFVVDNNQSRVVEFSATGGFLNQFGSDGSANGQFTNAEGIAIDSSGNAYVTDADLNRVSKFDSTGAFSTSWGQNNSGTGHQALGHLSGPKGIAWSPGDGSSTPASIFVVDEFNQRVQQFTTSGGNVDEFGSNGSSNGQFTDPIGIAAANQVGGSSPGTNVYVADKSTNLIQEFAPNQPPSNTAVPVVTGSAIQGQTLTTDNGSWTNSPTSYVYDWKRCDNLGANCNSIAQATQQHYVLTSSDVGKTIESCVKAHNAAGDSASEACSTTTQVVQAPPPPVNETSPALSGTAAQGRVLQTDDGTWQNSPSSFTYQWQRCDSAGNNCTDIGGATNNAYTLTGDDVGVKVRAVVTAHNAASTATSAPSGPSDIVAGPPAAPTTAPSISGTAQDGQELTAVRGVWPSDASNSYSYQWERCDSAGGNCADIAGATAQTYDVGPGDVGFTLAVRVTAANASVPTTSATSAPTGVVAAAPVPTPGPGPGPGTGPGSSPVTVVTGSHAGVTGSSPTTSTVLTNGVPVSVQTVSGGKITAVLLIDGKTARKAHLGNGKHSVEVGHAVATAGPDGSVHLKLKLTAKAKKAIKKLKSYKLQIKITITDAAGKKFTITRQVTVRRKGGKK